MTIGQKIKAARIEKKMTQAQLAEKMHKSTSWVGMYESGQRNPKYETIQLFAKALGVSLVDLTTYEERSELLTEAIKAFTDEAHKKAENGSPFVKQSPMQMHHAGILKFNSESDRIAYFYGLLNTDGKLVAARGMFNNLDESKLTEVADYIEKLADTPQYQNVPAADAPNH
jgi:transcriptional regulator with XRE-family HTH domain